MKLNELTIIKAKSGLQKKEFSSLELVKDCLTRIVEQEPKLNAFITVCGKEALGAAGKFDRNQQFNLPLGGIPIAVKDLFCTKGIRTTAGANVLSNFIPVYDSTAVDRLKKAGAIIIGKTNLDAWAHGSSGENSDFGPTKNPWDLTRVPGGSSSGSAVSVAAGECLGATGTDTGGSIRLPASFCNVVGVKPTYGRVSRYGVIAMASSLDSIGHFAKTVEDAALLLKITGGFDNRDSTTPKMPVPDYPKILKKGIKNLKIGIPKEYFSKALDPQIKLKINLALKEFSKLECQIEEISLPHSRYALAVYYLIQPAEVSSNLARFDGLRFGFPRNKFAPEAKRRIMLGTYILSAGYYEAYYVKAMKVRTLIISDFKKAFEKVDLIAGPVSPSLPFKLGEKTNDPLQMYLSDILTIPANLAGLPDLSIPIGFINNLPVGMQLIGPSFKEDWLFQAGYAYQQVTNWHEKQPFS